MDSNKNMLAMPVHPVSLVMMPVWMVPIVCLQPQQLPLWIGDRATGNERIEN